MNDVRTLIPTAHGHIADHLAANRQDTTILMTGGDTLMGYMKLIGCTQITPVCEIEQGVVVSNLKKSRICAADNIQIRWVRNQRCTGKDCRQNIKSKINKIKQV